MTQSKKRSKDPKDIVEEVPEALPSHAQPLVLDPDCLNGVASAYRYKLTVQNPEMEHAALYFDESVDVFAFNDVNKKRALKKQDWPSDAPLDHPRRFNVKVHLLAGNTEIKSCGGCSMWKDMTKKPFLILTPHGTRCVEFAKNPFILLIFRCCPKFHSYTQQFTLRVVITHNEHDIVYATELPIHRKKMNNPLKKRKVPSSSSAARGREEELDDFDEEQDEEEEDEYEHEEQLQPQAKKPRIEQRPISAQPPTANCSTSSSNKMMGMCSPHSSCEMPKYPSPRSELQAALALHETLFPHEAKLLKPCLGIEHLPPQDSPLARSSPEMVRMPFRIALSSWNSKPFNKQAKGMMIPHSAQPFQQFQEAYDFYNAHYEQGQQVPQQWGTPAQLLKVLYPSKQIPSSSSSSKGDLVPAPSSPVVLADPSLQHSSLPLKHRVVPQTPARPSSPDLPFSELTNDEKWLSSVLDDVPFSHDLFESIPTGFEPF